ncbi:hypothetical protein BAZSYMB_SCAFFOLD00118_0 [Bathymodiolus azoricus thioautotrophic gill symbiont]|uniref:Secreted protein n=1 Tax=Bathymodiolus azoricus thioautotrophic gill symbiont TaxID=235205 RepID=A0A1H6LFQ6_9GAMM|nr:hypothetical protein BAZSYMB_SCAFFOLD00118_0 [Bathymodiolus azoricus thioautotrophic gill symbiont]
MSKQPIFTISAHEFIVTFITLNFIIATTTPEFIITFFT